VIGISDLSQLERCQSRFTAFYAGQHNGRKLTWLLDLSKGELVTTCFKASYVFQVSTYQMAVLTLFNGRTGYTVREIGELTNIKEETLVPLIELLVKTNLLRTEGRAAPNDGLNLETKIELFKQYRK
jgi:cullin 1